MNRPGAEPSVAAAAAAAVPGAAAGAAAAAARRAVVRLAGARPAAARPAVAARHGDPAAPGRVPVAATSLAGRRNAAIPAHLFLRPAPLRRRRRRFRRRAHPESMRKASPRRKRSGENPSQTAEPARHLPLNHRMIGETSATGNSLSSRSPIFKGDIVYPFGF